LSGSYLDDFVSLDSVVKEPSFDSSIDPSLLASKVAEGFEPFFDKVQHKGKSVFLPRDGAADFRQNADEKVGIFTTTDLRDAARCAQAAYHYADPESSDEINFLKDNGAIIHTLKPLKAEVSWYETIFENQDTGLFIEKSDGTAVVAFKGSDRLQTWISDFDALMTDHEDGGRYHSGFLKMYKELEVALFNNLTNFAEKNGYTIEEAIEKTTFTGHSRGGGTTYVAADIVRRKLGAAPKVITFAAPRALHKHTVADYNEAAKEKTLNFTQDKDPVHYAAFSFLNSGAHPGNKVYAPLDQGHLPHQMAGYRNMANMMHALEEVSSDPTQQGGKKYKFEAYQEERDLKNETDHSLQAYAESALSTATSAASTVASAVTSAASTVLSPVTSAWNWMTGK
jgi:hypothetical protein